MKHKRKLKRKFIIILLAIVLLLGIGFFVYQFFIKGDKKPTIPKIIPKVQIVDESSKSRPYAVMINNLYAARPYQSGLQDAYAIYEIIAEGGITRYMALFKDKDTARIGSVRSSRPYYLDYAMENDAIYAHWGYSEEARLDINSYKINNINGLTYEGVYFFRDKTLNVDMEHTGFTSMELIKKATDELGYRKETDKDFLFNYTTKKLNFSKDETAKKADNISIEYSQYITSSYTYDEEAKVYKRFVNGDPHKDYVTGNQYTFKNIITYKVKNTSIDSYGRQKLDNIGSGEGYFITNGYAVPITWEKTSRDAQTVYKYKDGKEIKLSDGNTFIQIQPMDKELLITENAPETTQE